MSERWRPCLLVAAVTLLGGLSGFSVTGQLMGLFWEVTSLCAELSWRVLFY